MKCFAIIPFAAAFDTVFEAVKTAASHAVDDLPLDCYWLKDVHAAGRITDDIVNGLEGATLCIADVTGSNPNVMWETGYAMALKKPTILIGQDISALPFDLRSHRVLQYSLGDLGSLQIQVVKAVRDTLARHDLARSQPTRPSPRQRTASRTISVTGSMCADEASVARRHDTDGDRYGASTCATFRDASVESLPRGLSIAEGPNRRDALFCIKSDLVVLFWDGRSLGTKEIVRYFLDQGVCTVVAFI